MKANNLTISIPTHGCNKNCPYCISKMTMTLETNETLIQRNIEKVLSIARISQVTNVLITAQGEPMLAPTPVCNIGQSFKEFPLELQTNGILLNDESTAGMLEVLYETGFDVIAISVDSLDNIRKFGALYHQIKKNNMLVRLCINVSNKLPGDWVSIFFLNYLQDFEIDQVLIRNISVPKNPVANESLSRNMVCNDAIRWIHRHCGAALYNYAFAQFHKMNGNKEPVRNLPFGMKVWDYKGVGVSFSDYCIQEENTDDNMRSLIFREDGHLYPFWHTKAGVIF